MNIKLKKIYFDCEPVLTINDVKMSIWTYNNMFEVQILSQGFILCESSYIHFFIHSYSVIQLFICKR